MPAVSPPLDKIGPVTISEPILRRTPSAWLLRARTLALGTRTLVMGIVNITPDSFTDGGLYLDPARAVEHGLALLEEGADLLDLGAESTRPGSAAGPAPVEGLDAFSSDEEQTRLLPVIEGILKARPNAILSVDTYRAATARAAVAAGCEIVNDVSGFTWDHGMPSACSDLQCGTVLMHARGTPAEWRTLPALAPDAVLPLVLDGLAASLAGALAAGIDAKAIVLDPGYGFGKRLEENYALLARQAQLLALGRPLLAGLSRKGFLVRTLQETGRANTNPDAAAHSRDNAGVAALVAAVLNGASIVRVHRVAQALEAAAIADAILNNA
jgi:dihydropteroate synthase